MMGKDNEVNVKPRTGCTVTLAYSGQLVVTFPTPNSEGTYFSIHQWVVCGLSRK